MILIYILPIKAGFHIYLHKRNTQKEEEYIINLSFYFSKGMKHFFLWRLHQTMWKMKKLVFMASNVTQLDMNLVQEVMR